MHILYKGPDSLLPPQNAFPDTLASQVSALLTSTANVETMS